MRTAIDAMMAAVGVGVAVAVFSDDITPDSDIDKDLNLLTAVFALVCAAVTLFLRFSEQPWLARIGTAAWLATAARYGSHT